MCMLARSSEGVKTDLGSSRVATEAKPSVGESAPYVKADVKIARVGAERRGSTGNTSTGGVALASVVLMLSVVEGQAMGPCEGAYSADDEVMRFMVKYIVIDRTWETICAEMR